MQRRYLHKIDELFAFHFGVKGRLGDHNLVLLEGSLHNIVHKMVHDLFHFIDLLHTASNDRFVEVKHSLLGESLISDIPFFLVHADHSALRFRLTHDHGNNVLGSIV